VRRKVVLVSGAPGAGKSTVATHLAPLLQMPLVSKDLIKECLWDAFEPPSGDYEWSRRLGAAAMEILWMLAEQSPAVVLEANFRPHSSYEQAKLRSLSARLVEVYCWCPPEVAIERYAGRARRPSHHRAHVSPTLDPDLLAEFDGPMGVGTLIRLDTTLRPDVSNLATEVSMHLGR
jgi:predicted kinase